MNFLFYLALLIKNKFKRPEKRFLWDEELDYDEIADEKQEDEFNDPPGWAS